MKYGAESPIIIAKVMFFERKKYLDLLVKGQRNGMVKIVTGIRRSGKSFLLFEIFRNHLIAHGVGEDHIIGLSFDELRARGYSVDVGLVEVWEKIRIHPAI